MNDEITEKIYSLCKSFLMNNKGLIEPNVVYLGHNQWYKFRNETHSMILDASLREYMIFGMKIKNVVEDNYLAVGFVIEE